METGRQHLHLHTSRWKIQVQWQSRAVTNVKTSQWPSPHYRPASSELGAVSPSSFTRPDLQCKHKVDMYIFFKSKWASLCQVFKIFFLKHGTWWEVLINRLLFQMWVEIKKIQKTKNQKKTNILLPIIIITTLINQICQLVKKRLIPPHIFRLLPDHNGHHPMQLHGGSCCD